MPQITCRGLLFDMDGVLVDSTPAVARVWSRWALKYGFDPAKTTKLAHGRPSLATIQQLLPAASPEIHNLENDWMEREEIADIEDVTALPGTVELLSTLAPTQFAVVTSATRPLAEVRLRAAGLLKYAHHFVTSADIQRGKPDPEPYVKGAATLQLEPEECVVIEDAPSGVRSGKGAGARVIAVRTTTDDSELLAAGTDWIVNDCSEIRLWAGSAGHAFIAFELIDSTSIRQPRMS